MTSQNSSKSAKTEVQDAKTPQSSKRWWWLVVLPLWVYVAFWAAQLLVGVLSWLMVAAVDLVNMTFSTNILLGSVNQVVWTTVLSAIVYILALIVVIIVPLRLWRRKTTLGELGVTDWPSWMDIVLTPLAVIVYMFTSGVVILLVTKFASGIDLNQPQELPFSSSMLGAQWQYLLAFVTLVVMAPIAEELLFRGYLYGKLRKTAPIWISVIVASLAFGLAHLWVPGSALQWAVAIDTFVLSIFMCLMREYTGAIWVGVLMHMVKNGLAFYLLFVNPQVIDQLKAAVVPFF